MYIADLPTYGQYDSLMHVSICVRMRYHSKIKFMRVVVKG